MPFTATLNESTDIFLQVSDSNGVNNTSVTEARFSIEAPDTSIVTKTYEKSGSGQTINVKLTFTPSQTGTYSINYTGGITDSAGEEATAAVLDTIAVS